MVQVTKKYSMDKFINIGQLKKLFLCMKMFFGVKNVRKK